MTKSVCQPINLSRYFRLKKPLANRLANFFSYTLLWLLGRLPKHNHHHHHHLHLLGWKWMIFFDCRYNGARFVVNKNIRIETFKKKNTFGQLKHTAYKTRWQWPKMTSNKKGTNFCLTKVVEWKIFLDNILIDNELDGGESKGNFQQRQPTSTNEQT